MKYRSEIVIVFGVLSALLGPSLSESQTLTSSYPLRGLPLFLRPAAQDAQTPTAPGQTAKPGKLNINVIGGAGAVNDVRQRAPRDITVEVDDENDHPVPGALVTFFAPNEGPGGSFVGDSHLLTVMTGTDGRAVAKEFRPNEVVGDYKIQVNVSLGDEVATATVSQSNVAPAEALTPKRTGMSSKKIGLIVAAGAAVAVGAAIGLSHGGSSSSGGNSPGQTATLGVGGSPTVGAPH